MLEEHKDPQSSLNWADITLELNEALGTNYDYNTVRKGNFLLDLITSNGYSVQPDGGAGAADDDTYVQRKLDAEKAMVKLRDERNEISRLTREAARRESMMDMWREVLRTEISPMVGYERHVAMPSDNDLVVMLSDIHCGIAVDSHFNTYNADVMGERLRKYLAKIEEIVQRHHPEKCYVFLGGDNCSGNIHLSLRLENNMDVIRQVQTVSVAISEFVAALSRMFSEVYVHSVSGNHGRTLPKKEDNWRMENYDELIPSYVEVALRGYENIQVRGNDIEPSVAMFSVRNNNVFGVHGDKDNPDNCVQKLTMMFGVKPDVVLMGHRHVNSMSTHYDSRVYQCGSVVGADGYCMDHRLRNKPEQVVLVMTDQGVDCAYNVVLD